jgi:hypothetical protein
MRLVGKQNFLQLINGRRMQAWRNVGLLQKRNPSPVPRDAVDGWRARMQRQGGDGRGWAREICPVS